MIDFKQWLSEDFEKQKSFNVELPHIKAELHVRKERLQYITNPNAQWWYKNFDKIEQKIIEKLKQNWDDVSLHTSSGRKVFIIKELSNALQNGLISRRSYQHLKTNHGLHINSLFNTINKATKKPWTTDEIRAVLRMPKEYRAGTFSKGWSFPT